MPRPMTPAPTTIVFGRCDGTTTAALMTDSLHRACPARFSGSDLSRPAGGTPASRQFQAEALDDARIFCAGNRLAPETDDHPVPAQARIHSSTARHPPQGTGFAFKSEAVPWAGWVPAFTGTKLAFLRTGGCPVNRFSRIARHSSHTRF